MAAQSALVGRTVLLLLGGAVAAVVGYRTLQPDAPDPAPDPVAVAEPAADPVPTVAAVDPDPSVAPEPVVEDIAIPAPEPEPAAPESSVPPPAPPSFDVVRIEADGAALIAGTSPPDAQISLLLDGVQETRVQADTVGNWVAQLTLTPNPAPRRLSLLATLEDGTTLDGVETVAIAPIAAVVPAVPAVPEATEPVPEPAPPATLLVTEDGAEVLQAPVPVAAGEPVPVTLDAISYAPDGAVQLAGRGQGGAALRVYLDNVAVTDSAVRDDGAWALTLPDTTPGMYTLRIDQLDADGAVTARTETPFKRETLQALALAAGQAAPPTANDIAAPAVVGAAQEPEPVPAPEVEPADAEPPAQIAEVEPVSEPVSEPAAVEVAQVAAAPLPVTITVQPGFTLWGIANDMMGEGTMYVQVFEANKDKIRDPDLIYPGQVFTVPQD